MNPNNLKVGRTYRASCSQCSDPVLRLKIRSIRNQDEYVRVTCLNPIPECCTYSAMTKDGCMCGVIRSRFIEEITEANILGNFPKKGVDADE